MIRPIAKLSLLISMCSPAIFVCLMIALVPIRAAAGAARRQINETFPTSTRRLARCCGCCFCSRRNREQLVDGSANGNDDRSAAADGMDVKTGASCSALVRSVLRPVLIYLMLGNLYLVKTAIEPMICVTTLDGTRYISTAAAIDIQCNLCHTEADEVRFMSYRTLYLQSIFFFTLYALGTPLLFMIILAVNRSRLHTNNFVHGFGFLCSKMHDKYYWWEVWISFRKTFLVITVMLSVGRETFFSLLSMYVVVCALLAHVWVRPFAHVDANLAELMTLVCTILAAILGLRSGASNEQDRKIDNVQKYTNCIIYAVGGSCPTVSIGVVIKRLVGAWSRWRNSGTLLDMDEYYQGGTVPDNVRKMLHKRKVELAAEWISLKSKDENGRFIRSESQERLTHQERMIKVFESVAKYSRATDLGAHDKFAEWESYFPQNLRPAMYAWSMRQDPQAQAEADGLNWFIDQLKSLEQEQHQFLP